MRADSHGPHQTHAHIQTSFHNRPRPNESGFFFFPSFPSPACRRALPPSASHAPRRVALTRVAVAAVVVDDVDTLLVVDIVFASIVFLCAAVTAVAPEPQSAVREADGEPPPA